MSNQLIEKQNTLTITSSQSLFSIENITHTLKVADLLSKTDIIPKQYKGKPNDILVCMEYGRSLGLGSLQSLQSIAVINGVPTIWGDSLLAVAQQHKDYEYIKETPLIKEDQVVGYDCTIKRKGHDEHTARFTIQDAKVARLWGKPGPWTNYPQRMLMWRARSFAIRNIFSDALRGVKDRDEVRDYQKEKDITPSKDSNKDLQQELSDIVSKNKKEVS